MITRRTFQNALVAAPFAAGGAMRAEARADLDIAIIGAGAAGLMAAHRAREKGLTARIFEARHRVGGRIHTDAALGIPFDAGAFYIHFAERNPWYDAARALNVELVDDNTLWGGFNVFRNGQPIPMEERSRRRGAFGRLSAALDNEAPGADLSFAEAARRIAPELAEAAAGLTLLSLGENPERVSIRDYQRLDSGDDYVLPAGYGALLEAYARGLDIRLAIPVSGIDLSGDAARLILPGGVVTARAVIVTVSVGVLQAGGIRFSPELPQTHRDAIAGLGMGALTKVALKIEGNRFGLSPWTQFFDQGTSDDLLNIEFWPFGRAIAIAFLGGDYARRLAAQGEAAAVEAVRARLVAILGHAAGSAITGGRLAGWSADHYALGSYSIVRPGQVAARAALEEPVAQKLWFAGEANAGPASMTAGGAAIAGRRAVDQIAARLSR
jgi:monoamine oxidase